MKTLRFLSIPLFVAILSLGFCACSDKDEPDEDRIIWAFITIEDQKYELDGNAQEISVKVTCNTDYELRMPEEDWITLKNSQALDDSTKIYLFTISSNNSDSRRDTFILFWTNTISKGVAVYQDALSS